jgi:hypothetical protein
MPTCKTIKTLHDLELLKNDRSANNVDNTLALLLQPYRDIKDNKKHDYIEPAKRYFIAEGTETVRLLIQQQLQQLRRPNDIPPIQLQSVFIKTTAFFENPVN